MSALEKDEQHPRITSFSPPMKFRPFVDIYMCSDEAVQMQHRETRKACSAKKIWGIVTQEMQTHQKHLE